MNPVPTYKSMKVACGAFSEYRSMSVDHNMISLPSLTGNAVFFFLFDFFLQLTATMKTSLLSIDLFCQLHKRIVSESPLVHVS